MNKTIKLVLNKTGLIMIVLLYLVSFIFDLWDYGIIWFIVGVVIGSTEIRIEEDKKRWKIYE